MAVHEWVDDERLYAADLNSSFDSVLAEWGCRAINNSAISTTTAVAKVLNFDSEYWDSGGFHSNVTNNNRLTIPKTGVYTFGGHAEFASNATGYRQLQIHRNGTDILVVHGTNAINGVATNVSITDQWYFTAGDYIELLALQNSGGNLNVNSAAAYSPVFWIVAARAS